MQSTGHSSMHDLSRTSTQGCAMMYVTSELLFRHYPGGSGASQYPGPGQVCREGGRSRGPGPLVSPAGRRLSAQLDGARRWCACVTDPAFGPRGRAPLVTGEAHLVDAVG